jgi:hypothetical protein
MSERKERIKAALEEIADRKNGRLAAEDVVEAAKNPHHDLHDEFEWDDRKAAAQHRLDRARQLITYVTITVTHTPIKIVSPYYVRDPTKPSHAQGHIALTSSELRIADAKQILLNEFSRIESAIDRGRGVAAELEKTFPGMSDSLEGMLETIIELRDRLIPPPPPPPPRGRRRQPGEAHP